MEPGLPADRAWPDRWSDALARLPGDRGLALAAWFAALFLVAPSIAWYDDAEFVSAAWCLGVPHPTGFPLYDVLARAAQLLPIGSVPFRTHLVSLACAFGAVLLGARLLRRAGVSLLPSLALLIGTMLVATRTLFLHSATAEVYLPSLLLVMGGLELAVESTTDLRRVPMLAFLTGLGGAHHAAAALMLGALLVLVVWSERRRLGFAGAALVPVVVLAGLLALAYLPIRAAAEPFRNWGDPRTVSAFVEHITGARIARSFGEFGRMSPAILLVRVQLLGRVLLDDLGPIPVLAPLGAAFLALTARRRRLLAMLALVMAVDVGFTLVLNPMGIADRQTCAVTLFATLLLAVIPLAALVRRLVSLPLARGALLLVVPTLPLGLAPDALYEADLGRDYHALALAQAAFEQAPPGSVLVTTSDHLSAGALYLQAVEGFRLDTLHLVAPHVVESSHLRTLARIHGRDVFPSSFLELADQLDRHPELRDQARVQHQALRRLLDASAGRRKVSWEPGLSAYEKALFEAPPVGFPVATLGGADGNVGRQVQDFLVRTNSHVSRESAAALSTWLSQSATAAARRDDASGAMRLLQQALFLDPDNAKALVNMGAVLGRAGRLTEAIVATEHALQLRPDSVLAMTNLARYRIATGDEASADRLLDRARALDDTPASLKRIDAIRAGKRGGVRDTGKTDPGGLN